MNKGWSALVLIAALASSCGGKVDLVPDTRVDADAIEGVPHFPGAGGGGAPLPGALMSCYYGDDPRTPLATVEFVLETIVTRDAVHARVTFAPSFVDNTYGAGAIGWKKHPMSALSKSDHVELTFSGQSGRIALRFKLDYLSDRAATASGFGTLALGGDGSLIAGDAAALLRASTSLDRNLNERGYAAFTVDSPLTDDRYTPAPAAPDWDYRVVYEAWVDVGVFGSDGFGSAGLASVHASPSKLGTDTVMVTRRPCPKSWAL